MLLHCWSPYMVLCHNKLHFTLIILSYIAFLFILTFIFNFFNQSICSTPSCPGDIESCSSPPMSKCSVRNNPKITKPPIFTLGTFRFRFKKICWKCKLLDILAVTFYKIHKFKLWLIRGELRGQIATCTSTYIDGSRAVPVQSTLNYSQIIRRKSIGSCKWCLLQCNDEHR